MRNVKVLSLFTFFALLFAIFSCESTVSEFVKNESTETTKRSDNEIETFVRNGKAFIAGDIKIICGNNQVNSNNNCQLLADGLGHYECSFEECTLTISSEANFEDYDLSEQLLADNYDINAIDFFSEKYQSEFNGLHSVSYNFSLEKTVVLYEAILLNEDIQTVMFLTKYNDDGTVAKRFEIECDGACGCIEQFNLVTNVASCSCIDCTMTVTEVDQEKGH